MGGSTTLAGGGPLMSIEVYQCVVKSDWTCEPAPTLFAPSQVAIKHNKKFALNLANNILVPAHSRVR